MENNNIEQTLDVASTRQQILAKSLEIINNSGMVSFRIDTLATALNLSPGNITYHFSRKEDISVALWDTYLQEYNAVERQLTNLLDLKQVYLLNRINIQLNYKYRGVLAFRSSDRSAMLRDRQQGRDNEAVHHTITRSVMEILAYKGYVDTEATNLDKLYEMERVVHYMSMRWGINFAYQSYPVGTVEQNIDKISLLCLHAMYPLFTEKGRKEFEEIAQIIDANELVHKS